MPLTRLQCLIKTFVIALVVLSPQMVMAQPAVKDFAHLFTPPLGYVVYHTATPVVLDGDLKDEAWQQAAWTTNFQDIEGNLKPAPTYQTRVKMLWNDSCLYIAAQLHEPHVWATLKHHDDIIFNDNDFEVFIDPGNTTHQYYEIEINALNTLFDLFLNKPYRNRGNAMINWNAAGIKSAVKVQGTLNDPADTDEGWTVEMAIPFKALDLNNHAKAPIDGATWRINFSRVEWDSKVINGQYIKATGKNGKYLPEHNWVWSAQGVVNMHYPERWGYLQFSKQPHGAVTFVLPHAEKQKQYLWLIYYKQKAYFEHYHHYAANLKLLGIDEAVAVDKSANNLKLEVTAHQFLAMIANSNDKEYWAINQEGLIHKLTK